MLADPLDMGPVGTLPGWEQAQAPYLVLVPISHWSPDVGLAGTTMLKVDHSVGEVCGLGILPARVALHILRLGCGLGTVRNKS